MVEEVKHNPCQANESCLEGSDVMRTVVATEVVVEPETDATEAKHVMEAITDDEVASRRKRLEGFQMARFMLQLPQILKPTIHNERSSTESSAESTQNTCDGNGESAQERKLKAVAEAAVGNSSVALSLAEEIMELCDRVCVNQQLSCNELSCFLEGTSHTAFATWMLANKRIRCLMRLCCLLRLRCLMRLK